MIFKKLLFSLSLGVTISMSSQICFKATPTTYATTDGPIACVKGDFNGDGKKDFAVLCDRNGSIYRFYGTNTGTFTTHTYSGYTYMDYPSVGDFDKDGKDDIVFSQSLYKQLAVVYGKNTITGLFTSFIPYATAVADINNDGKLDVVASSFGGEIQTFLGTGTGFNKGSADTLKYNIYDLAAHDLNNDNFPDLVSGRIVYWGDGSGKFDNSTRITNKGYISWAGDLNNDQKKDMVVAFEDSVATYFNKGDQTFGNVVVSKAGVIGKLYDTDLNGDGKIDFVATSSSHKLSTYLGDGNGGFTFSADYILGDNVVGAAVFDVNNDTKPDVILPLRGQNETKVFLNNGTLSLPVVGTDTLAVCIKSGNQGQPTAQGTALRWSYPLPPTAVWIFGDTDAPQLPAAPGIGFHTFYVDQTVDDCRSGVSAVTAEYKECTVGITDAVLQNSTAVYPTLVTDVLNLSLTSQAPVELVVTDPHGLEVLRSKVAKEVSVQQLHAGLYFVKIIQEGKVAVKQFVKE